MSKIIPLLNLKINSKALIRELSTSNNSNNPNFRIHLIDMGIVPGRNIEILKKAFGRILIKVEQDTPLGIDKTVAHSIMVKPLENDAFEAADKKIQENLFSKFIKLFK